MSRRRRTRSAGTTYQIMYWHDIPVQVRAMRGRERHSVKLSKRFQVAVDQAAMTADLTGSDVYVQTFEWSQPVDAEGSPETVAEAVAAEIEEKYDKIDWQRTADALRDKT